MAHPSDTSGENDYDWDWGRNKQKWRRWEKMDVKKRGEGFRKSRFGLPKIDYAGKFHKGGGLDKKAFQVVRI